MAAEISFDAGLLIDRPTVCSGSDLPPYAALKCSVVNGRVVRNVEQQRTRVQIQIR